MNLLSIIFSAPWEQYILFRWMNRNTSFELCNIILYICKYYIHALFSFLTDNKSEA